MEKLQEYVYELTKASNQGKIVFFIGSGLSALSGYSNWDELVGEFYTGLHGKTKNIKYSFDECIKTAQIFYDSKGEKEYNRILRSVFSKEVIINPIHDKILSLNPLHIITTNYDDLIERACFKRGRFFSIIRSEEDVAKAALSSPNYLLKIHGDFKKGFEGDQIVLKENDYLDYEQKYPLICNLVKTIMATHIIVFIGYGLNDYNIKLLQNWVKYFQKENYNQPFFIRTEPEAINDTDKLYYEKMGFRIIDASSIENSNTDNYLELYNTSMDILIESKENMRLMTDRDIVNFLYQKLSPLFALQRVRKLDLNHVFEYDYHFQIDGTVKKHKNTESNYLERFFELKKKGTQNLSEDFKMKFDAISAFFKQNDILCMVADAGGAVINASCTIINPAYHNDYNSMNNFVQITYGDIENNYKKAFYLACLGRWEEAYKIYSDILLEAIKDTKWSLYYLSQINRYLLYNSIKDVTNYYEGSAILTYGKLCKPFSDDFIKQIYREMKNFNVDDVFYSMPYEFQDKFRVLKVLSDSRFLYEDTIRLFELTNKVRSEMSKGTYSLGGLTTDQEIYLHLNDNLSFLFENCLWYAYSHKFKQYIKNSLVLQFEKEVYEQTRDIDEFGMFFASNRTNFEIDYQDFVNIVKAFSIEDIKYIERICSIEKIIFRGEMEIENYLLRIANKIIEDFSDAGMNLIFYELFIKEAKSAFYFARYVKLNEESIITIIKALLFHYPEIDAEIGMRYQWIKGICQNNGLPESAIPVIEEYLITMVGKCSENEFSKVRIQNRDIGNFSFLINYYYRDYISKDLSAYTLELKEEMKCQIDYLYLLSSILSSDAKDYLMKLKGIENIKDLIDSLQISAVNDVSKYKYLIFDFMDKRMSDIAEGKQKGITQGYFDSYLMIIAIWVFSGELADTKMKKYLGLNDEYDFFVDPDTFDYNKFIPSWLKKYSDRTLKRIAKNEHMRSHIVEILKKQIKSTNEKKYIEIFMNHFTK